MVSQQQQQQHYWHYPAATTAITFDRFPTTTTTQNAFELPLNHQIPAWTDDWRLVADDFSCN